MVVIKHLPIHCQHTPSTHVPLNNIQFEWIFPSEFAHVSCRGTSRPILIQLMAHNASPLSNTRSIHLPKTLSNNVKGIQLPLTFTRTAQTSGWPSCGFFRLHPCHSVEIIQIQGDAWLSVCKSCCPSSFSQLRLGPEVSGIGIIMDSTVDSLGERCLQCQHIAWIRFEIKLKTTSQIQAFQDEIDSLHCFTNVCISIWLIGLQLTLALICIAEIGTKGFWGDVVSGWVIIDDLESSVHLTRPRNVLA